MSTDHPRRVSRRTVLKGLGATVGASVLGCADAGPGSGAVIAPNGPANACTGATTLTPSQLLSRIDTVVVLMMENRSFDHYLGSLRFVEGGTLDGLTGTEWNPDPNGQRVDVFHLENLTPSDPPHGWDPSHAQWNNGANDGFVIQHAGDSQDEVMGYYLRDQIPVTYALADSGAICDRWFCSVMGPTWPNRFYLHGATSKGVKNTGDPIIASIGFTPIFEVLRQAGLSGLNYYHDVPWALGGYQKTVGLKNMRRFFADAASGSLPNFSIIDPQFYGAGANDDHPDHDVRLGQAMIATVYSALAKSPQWNRMLFVITYDEHGGFFDHVSPPTVVDERPEFTQLGFRVPSLVLGPYVHRGCAVSTTFDHVSVLKTLQTRFGIAPLNDRMNTANDLSSCIDPATLDAPRPGVTLPVVTVPSTKGLETDTGDAHADLTDALAKVTIPDGIDLRSPGLGEMAYVLEMGQALGVVRVD